MQETCATITVLTTQHVDTMREKARFYTYNGRVTRFLEPVYNWKGLRTSFHYAELVSWRFQLAKSVRH